MMRKLSDVATLVIAIGALAIWMVVTAQTQGQKSRTPAANAFKASGSTQKPLYAEYKGVRIGMTATEARAKLGEPEMKGDDQDYYLFSEKEMAQIAYNEAHEVVCISIDYTGGVGAPDYRDVVGPEIDVRPDGSMYKLVRYEELGFWVSYNRTAAEPGMVTITIQKIRI